MKTCRRGHVHDAKRCPECQRANHQRSERHAKYGDAPPMVPLRYATHCPRGHALADRGLVHKAHGKVECRACVNAATRKRDAAIRDGTYVPKATRDPLPELPDAPVVVRLRERKATRDPFAALIFGGPA